MVWCLIKHINVGSNEALFLRQLVTGLSLWRLRFNPVPVHALLVLDKVALGWVFLGVLQFPFVSVIPAMTHAFLFISHRCYMNLAVDSSVKDTLKKKVIFVHYLMMCYKLKNIFCLNNAWYDDYE